MLDLEIKEYLSKVGIRRLHALDTALIEAFGQDEGERHIERLTHLYDQSESMGKMEYPFFTVRRRLSIT